LVFIDLKPKKIPEASYFNPRRIPEASLEASRSDGVYLKKSPKWSTYGANLTMALIGRRFEEI
jgi:hypothetical protein